MPLRLRIYSTPPMFSRIREDIANNIARGFRRPYRVGSADLLHRIARDHSASLDA